MSRPYYDSTGVHREPSDAEMLELIRKALHPDKEESDESEDKK